MRGRWDDEDSGDRKDFRPRRRGRDSDQEQGGGFGAPRAFTPSPPGNRFDQPSGGRFEQAAATGPSVKAVVKWFNPTKGFGFVELTDGGGDAFLHAAVLERAGHSGVDTGTTLEVRVGAGQKGMQVTEVVGLDNSTAFQEPARRPRPDRPERSSYDQGGGSSGGGVQVRETGTVKFYNAEKGFGFIVRDAGGKDIFVHRSALERAGIMNLAEGQRVIVDVVEGRKGPEAGEVRLG